jgi:octaprenyl-diphosphate synthase
MTSAALASLTDCIRPQLAGVEKLFHDELASDLSCVNTLIKHVSRFRGKMLRPSLVLLSGRACGELTEAHTAIATVVEMVHMATLVHDDVPRRGRAAAERARRSTTSAATRPP